MLRKLECVYTGWEAELKLNSCLMPPIDSNCFGCNSMYINMKYHRTTLFPLEVKPISNGI